MSRIHEDLPHKDFEKPESVITATVCDNTGLQMNTFCLPRTEIMDKDSVPKDMCMGHFAIRYTAAEGYMLGNMCSQTGKVASDTCPYKMVGMVNPTLGYCIHSYENGLPLFTEADLLDQTTNAAIYAQSAVEQAQAANIAIQSGATVPEAGDASTEIPGLPAADTPAIDPNLEALLQAMKDQGLQPPEITPNP